MARRRPLQVVFYSQFRKTIGYITGKPKTFGKRGETVGRQTYEVFEAAPKFRRKK